MTGRARRVAELWPRRAPGLPPGQRRLPVFPRFADQPLRRPPAQNGPVELTVRASDGDLITIGLKELTALGTIEQFSDFHCVTTWTHEGLAWGGVPLLTVWRELVEPPLGDRATAPFILAVGADRHEAVFCRDDLLAPDVLLAFTLGGHPLDGRHGAPMRIVSPAQYGYKNVKHLVALELHDQQPRGRLGAKEHLRARVSLEERHSRLPARLLRLPYRLLIPLTALVAERSAAASPIDR